MTATTELEHTMCELELLRLLFFAEIVTIYHGDVVQPQVLK